MRYKIKTIKLTDGTDAPENYEITNLLFSKDKKKASATTDDVNDAYFFCAHLLKSFPKAVLEVIEVE